MAWRRLNDAYAAMEHAEIELAAALEAVVVPAASSEAGGVRAVTSSRSHRGVRASEVRG